MNYWWVWFVASAFFYLVQMFASLREKREGDSWSIWRTLAVTAMVMTLLIGAIRFVKWVWNWA
jgi:hypothetical protein